MSASNIIFAAANSDDNDWVMSIQTTAPNEDFGIQFVGVNGTVSWGDGTYSTVGSPWPFLTHTYASVGTYEVKGRFAVATPASVYFRVVSVSATSTSLPRSLLSWGNVPWTTLNSAFNNCQNLIYVPPTLPKTVTSLTFAFSSCTAFNANITGWDVSAVTTLANTFQFCSNFNQPIGSWNVSNVTSLDSTFQSCTSFNQPLNTWNTSSVTTMFQTFTNCTSFNRSLSNWNLSNTTTIQNLFSGCTSFNQDLSTWSWNTNNVTNMAGLFQGCSSFNSPIFTWNTANVTNMSSMFSGATIFNQSLSSLNTSNVTDMSYMFYAASAFNQSINTWDTSKVTNMSYMFYNTDSYNQPMNSLNVSKVTDFSYMFSYTDVFNQPLNNWNTSSATNMDQMFRNAIAFAQNLSSWCVGEIISSPSSFSLSAGALTPPVWGTCPTGVPSATITRVGSVTGTDSATLPTHQTGDLILAFAFRDGSTTLPTLPSGWTSLRTRTATTVSGRLAYKIAQSASETTGTWTNATACIFVVYRNANNDAIFQQYAQSGGSSSNAIVSYSANAYWSNLAWTVAFAGSNSSVLALETPPTGATTLVATFVNVVNEAASFDSNGVSASFATATVNLGTASAWITMTFRMRVPFTI